jgi:DNA repair exonuclease SbcCD nuclease subunit
MPPSTKTRQATPKGAGTEKRGPLPRMWKTAKPKPASKVIAIACADIHLSDKPPVARSAEQDWYDSMARPLDQLRSLSKQHDCPILCAGDVFHKWDSPAQLINFALEMLPDRILSIYGQHDLPNHNPEEIKRSAFWTLCKSKKITGLEVGRVFLQNLAIEAFPFGTELQSAKPHDRIKLALIHRYVWYGNYKYEGAPEEGNAVRIANHLKGFNLVISGDNHLRFTWQGVKGLPTVFNAGSLMRRNIDQIQHRPRVGLIWSDGRITSKDLDSSQDRFIDISSIAETGEAIDRFGISNFLEEIAGLKETTLEFREVLDRWLESNKVSSRVRNVILAAVKKK